MVTIPSYSQFKPPGADVCPGWSGPRISTSLPVCWGFGMAGSRRCFRRWLRPESRSWVSWPTLWPTLRSRDKRSWRSDWPRRFVPAPPQVTSSSITGTSFNQMFCLLPVCLCSRRRCRSSLLQTGTASPTPPPNACRSWIRTRPWLLLNRPSAAA